MKQLPEKIRKLKIQIHVYIYIYIYEERRERMSKIARNRPGPTRS
jgi:hypothetical protein